MNKLFATIEFLSGQRAAILALTDVAGEWAGSGRVEGRNRLDIYERAYTLASLLARSKGGRIERLSVVKTEAAPDPRAAWLERREACGASVTATFQHRRVNALNVEPMQPFARCLEKKPPSWPEGSSALRWLASGGEPFVFGPCSVCCPRASERAQ